MHGQQNIKTVYYVWLSHIVMLWLLSLPFFQYYCYRHKYSKTRTITRVKCTVSSTNIANITQINK